MEVTTAQARNERDRPLGGGNRHTEGDSAREEAAKRQRLSPSEDQWTSVDATGNPETFTVLTSERQFKEMPYMGTTRVLVGPGFQVRELLFEGDRVSAASGFAELPMFALDEPTLEALTKALHKAAKRDQSADVTALTAITRATSLSTAPTAESRSTGLLDSAQAEESKAPTFLDMIEAIDEKLGGITLLEPVNFPSPLLVTRPSPFTRTTFTGSVSVTWATGVSTGAASLTFPCPTTANNFLRGFCTGQIRLPWDVAVRLLGVVNEDGVPLADSQDDPQWYPPLKTVHFDHGSSTSVYIFDELQISMMSAVEFMALRFVAEISSGLPPQVDEVELKTLLRPHECVVAIRRAADPSANHSEFDARPSAPLQTFLTASEKQAARWSKDTDSQRANMRVDFEDLTRLAQVYARAADTALWTSMQTPCGQPVRLEVAYELRTFLANDMFQCFHANLAEVQLWAQAHGVSWTELRVSNELTHVEIVLRSSSRAAVEHVSRVLEAVIESEAFSHPVLVAAFDSQSEWKKLVRDLIHAANVNNTICLRADTPRRLIWINGSDIRRCATMDAMKKICLVFQQYLPQTDPVVCGTCKKPPQGKYTRLTNCSHTCCLGCIQPRITALSSTPLRCPAENCGCALHVDDIIKLSDNLDALLKTVLLDFVARHSHECFACPTPGCNQVVPRHAVNDRTGYQVTKCATCKPAMSNFAGCTTS